MVKNETYLQVPPAVECFARGGKTLVTMRKDVAEATEAVGGEAGDGEGAMQAVWHCTELTDAVDGTLDAAAVEADFDGYWAQLTAAPVEAPTTEQRLEAVEEVMLALLNL